MQPSKNTGIQRAEQTSAEHRKRIGKEGHLIPPGQQLGIPNLGWHDFRHTYRAMMDEEKLTLEEQRVLMRHEDIRTTLGYGGKSKAETVRGANARVAEMLRK
jgi:integrase